MNDSDTDQKPGAGKRGLSTGWIVLIAILMTAALSYWVITTFIYPQDFTPVTLPAEEQQQLERKLQQLGYQPDNTTRQAAGSRAQNDFDREGRLIPRKYSEQNGERTVEFSERELNALLASNPDMARKLAIDLSDDLISARLLIPLDKDFPMMGGRTLRVSAGVETAFSNGRPRVILKGVTVMGVPLPNAWLGNLKNIDLIREFGDSHGFWKSFADGVEDIRVADGKLRVQLKP